MQRKLLQLDHVRLFNYTMLKNLKHKNKHNNTICNNIDLKNVLKNKYSNPGSKRDL